MIKITQKGKENIKKCRRISSTIGSGWGPHSFAAGRRNTVGFRVEPHPSKCEPLRHPDLQPTS